MSQNKHLRGVSDIVEDGYGGFTMDSVFYQAGENDKWVTSVFKRVDPEPPTEAKNWNPTSFNFKAAVGDSPQRKKAEVQEKKIKEAHYSKKNSSGRNKQTGNSLVRRHLEEVFDDSCSDILTDVTNESEKSSDKNIFAEDQKQKQKPGEQGIKNWMRSMKEEHGIDCVYGEHIKGKIGDFDNLEIFPVDLSKEKNQDQEMGDQELNELVENLKEDHGEGCDCGEHIKGVMKDYEALTRDLVRKVVDKIRSDEGGNDGF